MKKTIRERFLSVVLGSKYKTNAVCDLVQAWVKSNKGGRIICYDPVHAVMNIAKISYLIDDDEFEWVDTLLRNPTLFFNDKGTLLVLNSANLLFPVIKPTSEFPFKSRPKMPRNFLDLLVRSRQLNLSIILAFEDPDSMPVNLDYYATHFTILPILENYIQNKNICNHEILDTAITCINIYNEVYSKNPTKEYVHIDIRNGAIYPAPAISKTEFKQIARKFKKFKGKVKILP